MNNPTSITHWIFSFNIIGKKYRTVCKLTFCYFYAVSKLDLITLTVSVLILVIVTSGLNSLYIKFAVLIYWWYILQLNTFYSFRLRCFFRLLWICSVYDSSKLPILYPSVVSQRSFVPFCIFPIVIWKYDSPLECSVIFANPWVSIISFVWVSIIETP